MSISDNYAPDKTSGNGVTAAFTGSWNVINADYFRLYWEDKTTGVQTLKTKGTHYTLAFTSSGYTATHDALYIPPSTVWVIRSRDITKDQTDPYKTSTGFQGGVIENSFDKVTAITQDMQDQLDRTPKFPLGSAISGITLPTPAAGKALLWNATEDALENSTDDFNDIVTDATAQAVAAAASASAASGSASAASASAVSAAASYDSFDDRYLGAKAADPTLDNDGNALLTGALYFNTGSNEMRVYDGAAWNALNPTALIPDGDKGDITVSASGATWTIDNLAVTNAKIANTTIDLTAKVTGTLPVANGGTGVATATAYAPLFGGTTGTGAFQSGTVGTSGQVLTSNGAGALPTFQAAASNAADIQTFTGSGTWTKPSGSPKMVLVQIWGGGASGASRTTTGRAGGGGGGAYNCEWFLPATLGATETVTIGAGGVGVSGNTAGNVGGNSTFGSWLTGYGGGGGSTAAAASGAFGGCGGGKNSAGAAQSQGASTTATRYGDPSSAGAPAEGHYNWDSTNTVNYYFPPSLTAGGGTITGGKAINGGGNGGGAASLSVNAESSVNGGGGGQRGDEASAASGGGSVNGGAGGGGCSSTAGGTRTGGTSLNGGNGGAGGAYTGGNGTDGSQPAGGGGGAVQAGTSGAGGAGKCVVTTFY